MGSDVACWKLEATPGASPQKVELDPPPASLDELSKRLPAGAYSTFRTFGPRGILRLSEHLARLEETARLSERPVTLDWAAVRGALRYALDGYGHDEARGRLTLDLSERPGTLYVSLAALQVPTPEHYANGVRAVTRKLHRHNPKAKSTSFLETASQVRAELPQGIYEGLMVDEAGRLLEGLSSNLFVVRDGEVWTADEGVLSGITRAVVLEEAQAMGVPLRLEGFPAAALETIDEAWITSASRAVLPVTEIDGRPVGDGRPGPISRALLARYQARLSGEVEEV